MGFDIFCSNPKFKIKQNVGTFFKISISFDSLHPNFVHVIVLKKNGDIKNMYHISNTSALQTARYENTAKLVAGLDFSNKTVDSSA